MKNLLVFVALAITLNASANSPTPETALKTIQKNYADPGFSFLRGHKQGQSGHALQWSMTTSRGIDHYEIQSTYEDPLDIYSNWTTEGTVVSSRPNLIKFTHQSVMPGFISYRVIAVRNDGGANVVSGIYSTTID